MKHLILSLFVSSILIIGFSNCNKNKHEENHCNLHKGQQATADMPIVFTASQTGDGVITSLYYKAGDKEETITNPNLPWTLTVNVLEGDEILISGVGTTTDGSLKITYDGKYNDGNDEQEISGTDECSNATN